MAIEAGSSTYYQAKRGVVQDGLVLNYDFGVKQSYDSGNTIYDLSGNGNNGTLTNGPSKSNNNGGVLNFDGTNDTVNFSYDLRSNFTFECWVMLDVVDRFCFLGQGVLSSAAGLHIWYYSSTKLRFGMYGTDYDASLSTATNTWYHYVFTYDHATYTKQIYRNAANLNAYIVHTPQKAYVGTGTVRIGSTYSSYNSSNFANGKFASARLYSKVLSADEISQNYNVTRHRFGV